MNYDSGYTGMSKASVVGSTARSTLAYAGEAPLCQPALDAHSDHLQGIIERVAKLGDAVREFNDRARGAIPQPVTEANGRDCRSGVVGRCQDAADIIADRIEYLESEVGRLSQIA